MTYLTEYSTRMESETQTRHRVTSSRVRAAGTVPPSGTPAAQSARAPSARSRSATPSVASPSATPSSGKKISTVDGLDVASNHKYFNSNRDSGSFYYYTSESNSPIDAPPSLLPPEFSIEKGDIYIHTIRSSSLRRQSWYFDVNSEWSDITDIWEKVEQGQHLVHPTDGNRVLIVHSDGKTPNWVLRQTFSAAVRNRSKVPS